MRFELNQQILVIQFNFVGEDNFRNTLFRMPYLYDDKEVEQINFKMLTVVEHHKVNWDYDEEGVEKKHDGFILKDEEGVLYHNQYPRASYGQTSDRADRLFTLAMDNDDTDGIIAKAEKGEIRTLEFYKMESVLSDMNKGIEDIYLTKDNDLSTQARYELLLSRLKTLKKRIKQEFETKYPHLTYTMVKKPLFEGAKYLVWRMEMEEREMDTGLPTYEEILTALNKETESFFKYEFDNKDSLVITRQTSRYAGLKEGQEITITFGEYQAPDEFDDRPHWNAYNTEHFSVSNIDNAIKVFLHRLQNRPAVSSGFGQSLEDIFEKE